MANLSISVRKGIVTTLEIFNATNLTLHLDHVEHVQQQQQPAESEQEHEQMQQNRLVESLAYGTVSLDANLDDVRISFQRPDLIDSIIATVPPSGSAQVFRKVSLNVTSPTTGSLETCRLADASGPIADMTSGQNLIKWVDDRWKTDALVRKEKDYPALNST